jgi:SAM-dependent methyltransferase
MVSIGAIACPVCGGGRIQSVGAATGQIAYCQTCFHGFRAVAPEYSYQANAMCALGTSDQRLEAQCAFFAPHVVPGARVLEIGCATGELAMATQRRLNLSSYEAIELSKAGDIAGARVSRLYRRILRELLADGEVDEGAFDAVLMSHVLEHIEEINAEVEAIASVLKPGGVAFFEVPQASGNIALPLDDNVAHLHFFSLASLTRLLSNHGLDVVAVESGARLDARYADSLRVVAQRFATPRLMDLDLGAHPALAGQPVVVWGAGSLATELLANFLSPDRIAYFVDKNPATQGTERLGRPVRAPQTLVGAEPTTILINSIDFAPVIAEDIAKMMPGHRHKLVRIGDLIEYFRDARLGRQRA